MWYKYPDIKPTCSNIYLTYDGSDFEFTRWVENHWRTLDGVNSVSILYWMAIPPIPKD